MDKPRAKVAFRERNLPVADDVVVRRGDSLADAAAEIRSRLGTRVVVKPTAAGSAIGVTRVEPGKGEPMERALEGAFAAGGDVLVEKLHDGLEVTCAVLDDDAGVPDALPPLLIVPKAATWYDFTSRYGKGGSEHQCPAPFSAVLNAHIQTIARGAHAAVGARDLSRVDFVVDDRSGEVTLLEVNTLPGMTATSLFPESAAAVGVSFSELCDRLVRRAHARPRPHYLPALPMP
jgi:D-alanine-D-alanine ligase